MLGWLAGVLDPRRTGVGEGEQGNQKKTPPIHREGVESRLVVWVKVEKGGGQMDGDGKTLQYH